MMNPMLIVARMMTDEAELGRMCRKMMRALPAPIACSASMNTDALSRRVSAYAVRVKYGQ